MTDRKYTHSFGELVDRMFICQLKELLIPEHREVYTQQIKDIVHDLDLICKEKGLGIGGQLFCFNCGGSFDMKYPQPVDMAGEMMKAFAKLHANCEKTWQEPVVDSKGKTEKENADWWLANGEKGISSKTMFRYLGGSNLNKDHWGDGHPHDPDDFKRCYKLLQAVPQWRDKLHLMKPVSPVWSNLVDNWDKLTEMYEENVRTEWKNYKKIGMYEFMESLGC